METNEMVQDVIREVNEGNKSNCKNKVRELVSKLLAHREQVKYNERKIVEISEELKGLRAPEEVQLDLSVG